MFTGGAKYGADFDPKMEAAGGANNAWTSRDQTVYTDWFPAEALPPIYVNKARAIQLESRLSLKRSEASAILRYKKEHGPFKSLEELLQVPGIDATILNPRDTWADPDAYDRQAHELVQMFIDNFEKFGSHVDPDVKAAAPAVRAAAE